PTEHQKLTGQGNENALAFAKFLSENGKKMWIRHVLVPDLTDKDEWLYGLRAFTDGLKTVEKTEVLPYHTMGEVKYQNLGLGYPLQGVPVPTKERIENAKRILCRK
ncbi:MAG: pyruvate formate lyase 1-activating protein, partial [Clostridia bacterium]|nr:pyruvate formate lyase 1-activating protein [Clostridia bacterium]